MRIMCCKSYSDQETVEGVYDTNNSSEPLPPPTSWLDGIITLCCIYRVNYLLCICVSFQRFMMMMMHAWLNRCMLFYVMSCLRIKEWLFYKWCVICGFCLISCLWTAKAKEVQRLLSCLETWHLALHSQIQIIDPILKKSVSQMYITIILRRMMIASFCFLRWVV